MTPSEEKGLKIAVEVFEKKCQKLVRHRRPNIYLKSNAELFSDWFEDGLDEYSIQKLGANAHPDLIINGVGFELKSLRANGQIQFNSTIPCGGFRHGEVAGECYYAVARYTTERNYGYLEDFTICDGDFFNHNRERAFAHHNEQETGFGDYGDGVVRHRKMYSFPSPLRTVQGISLISKISNVHELYQTLVFDRQVDRINTVGETFTFYVYRHNLLP
ncbi:hypothetical protein AV540_14140 [Brevibacillus parabrevis]|uniref:hypothetical protein n=1 Tax=Brevibacillus parabrevis TaxID=54914 RepID=UPI0007AC0AC9|nr:hypothetical protein [Brevibacillus parabrevis]KZE50080.1 hypothetical protein AV540_14140 [Brevibacillus parabrevis]